MKFFFVLKESTASGGTQLSCPQHEHRRCDYTSIDKKNEMGGDFFTSPLYQPLFKIWINNFLLVLFEGVFVK